MKLSYLGIFSCGLVLISCTSATLTGNRSEPGWVSSPQLYGEREFGKDAFYGVGKSNYSDVDIGLSEARDEARREVAAALKTEVDKKSDKIIERLRTLANDQHDQGKEKQKNEKIADAMRSKFTASETTLVKHVLTGSTIVASWRDPVSGTTWALAKIDRDLAQRAMIDEFKRAAGSAIIEMGARSNAEKKRIESAVEESVHEQ
jgi:hypothetical protein